MKTSQSVQNIAKSLAAAQGEIKNPEANEQVDVHAKKSEGGALLYSYRYATLPKCYDAGRLPLSKFGLSHVATLERQERGLMLTVRLNHESGEWYESEMPMPSNISSKDMAGEVTFWKRYLFNGLAGIAGDDDIKSEDGDRGPIMEASQGRPQGQRQRGPQGTQQPQSAASAPPATPAAQEAERAELGKQINAKMIEKGWSDKHTAAFVAQKYKAAPGQLNVGQLKNLLKSLETAEKPDISEPPPGVLTTPVAP
jgi:hypothetical protein